MKQYTFSDGHQITSNLSAEEVINRMNRLSTLIANVEGYESGTGLSIYNKAVRAYNKSDNFTGVIHLTFTEKDWLSYLLNDGNMLRPKDVEVINYYLRH